MDCPCTRTSFDLLNMINKKRTRVGLEPVTYDWMMIMRRRFAISFYPRKKIGSAYIWDGTTARQIVSRIWDKKYEPESKTFRWTKYAA